MKISQQQSMVKQYSRIIIVLIGVWLYTGCARHNLTMYDDNKIKAIDTWYISLESELGRAESAYHSAEKNVIKSRISSIMKCDLQLVNSIFSYLSSKYQINMTKDMTIESGFIHTKALCHEGKYLRVDISIHDQKENLLAEIEVKNTRGEFAKGNNEFGEYCAGVIAEVIRGR